MLSPRALGVTERQTVLDVLHSERFIDQSSAEVHATLLEEQTYLCAPRTMYRVLAAAKEVRERRAQARHPAYTAPELVATRPNQVWSWDITKLKGPISRISTTRCTSSSTSSAATPWAGWSRATRMRTWRSA